MTESNTDNVEVLYEAVATCPECECRSFYIHVDKLAFEFENITAFECMDCGWKCILKVKSGCDATT